MAKELIMNNQRCANHLTDVKTLLARAKLWLLDLYEKIGIS